MPRIGAMRSGRTRESEEEEVLVEDDQKNGGRDHWRRNYIGKCLIY